MSTENIVPLNTKPLAVKRALISVSDKTGIIELAQVLVSNGVQIISTGGTYNTIKKAGITVTEVSELTKFPECLDGRVKTLHPVIHAGILARTSYNEDVSTLNSLNIEAFELVIVNLYPFAQTIAKPDTDLAKAIEFVDIGGPTMVRAAAKNFPHVCILTSPDQYDGFKNELNENKTISYTTRLQLSRDAFQHTASYDTMIANYLIQETHQVPVENLNVSLPLAQSLRYGENPHQMAAVYGNQKDYIDCFHGKELSYNNFLDTDAAIELISEFDTSTPACVIVKHTNPCGVATGSDLIEAWKRAFETDKVSPFGGIIAVNQRLDLDVAKELDSIFSEIIIAPDFSDDAIKLLTKKANRRLIRLLKSPSTTNSIIRSIFGGVLVQQPDRYKLADQEIKVVSKRQPTEQEYTDLMFAWKIVKHVKSNAIVFVKNGQTLGIGNGQTSRVDSSELAVRKATKANLQLSGSALASDAFFPFKDGVEAAAKAGATAIIQPGGSVRDQEVIDCANELGLAMIFTGVRHFRH
ncbi:MAG TPA: bifunctional phosphoribosylaminoimidazolecarboxamide formyltransferase/inosine monophosphate cyclohydrolase [Bacteroidetes bacterium]|nr:bifunctional phosphoribosylaminoimidazolecarboxamide formyltransferase/inosine monophosphate cyclohydrolase [Bacteroidota bacterium]